MFINEKTLDAVGAEGLRSHGCRASAAVPGVCVALAGELGRSSVDLVTQQLDAESVLLCGGRCRRAVVVEAPPAVDALAGVRQLCGPSGLPLVVAVVVQSAGLCHLQRAEGGCRRGESDDGAESDDDSCESERQLLLDVLHCDPYVSG